MHKTNTVKTSTKNKHKINTEPSANLKRNVQNANSKERLSDMCKLRSGQKSCRKCPARFYCLEFKRKKSKSQKKVGKIRHAEKISEPNAISSKTKTTEMSDT